jgi:hypothetical protein
VWRRGHNPRLIKDAAVGQPQAPASATAAGALIGLLMSLFRRHWGVLAVILPAPLGLAFIAPRVTPYVDAKLYAMAAPSVLLAATIGLWYLWRVARPGRWVAAPVAALCAVVIIWSDALAYHTTPLAPTDRLEAIAEIGDRYEGQGPMLFNEFEEFAKYFARKANVNVSTDSTAVTFIGLRSATEAFVGRTYDLDQQQLEYIEGFGYVITRRKPGSSRPPANYELDYENAYYQVWKRTATPDVIAHLPLGEVDRQYGSGNEADEQVRCAAVRGFAESAPRGAHLVAAQRPEEFLMWVPGGFTRFSAGWVADGHYPGEAEMRTPGLAEGPVQVRGGRYDVWIRGSTGRPFIVRVDRERVASVKEINTPGGWIKAATLELAPGRHDISITRPGGSLGPGDAARSRIGGVVVARAQRGRLVEVPLDRAERLCGKRWDWIEVVRR